MSGPVAGVTAKVGLSVQGDALYASLQSVIGTGTVREVKR